MERGAVTCTDNPRTPSNLATRVRLKSLRVPFSSWLMVARESPLKPAKAVCVSPMSERRVRTAELNSVIADMSKL